jgi:hypothetical protein
MSQLERLIRLVDGDEDLELYERLIRELERRGSSVIDDDVAWRLIAGGQKMGSTHIPDVLIRSVLPGVRFTGEFRDATVGALLYVPIGMLLLYGLDIRDEPYEAPGFIDLGARVFSGDEVDEAFEVPIGFNPPLSGPIRVSVEEVESRRASRVSLRPYVGISNPGHEEPVWFHLISPRGHVIDDMLHALRDLFGSPPIEGVLYMALLGLPEPPANPFGSSVEDRLRWAFSFYLEDVQDSKWSTISDLVQKPPEELEIDLLRSIILYPPR